MGQLNRSIERNEAMLIYKERVRKIPKGSRISFSDFYKQYKKAKLQKTQTPAPEPTEDFDFSSIINTNTLTEDSIEVQEDEPIDVVSEVVEGEDVK